MTARRSKPRRVKPADGNLTVPRMIRFSPEDVEAQNAAAERDGRPWANWARRVLAEAASAAKKTS